MITVPGAEASLDLSVEVVAAIRGFLSHGAVNIGGEIDIPAGVSFLAASVFAAPNSVNGADAGAGARIVSTEGCITDSWSNIPAASFFSAGLAASLLPPNANKPAVAGGGAIRRSVPTNPSSVLAYQKSQPPR